MQFLLVQYCQTTKESALKMCKCLLISPVINGIFVELPVIDDRQVV